jgi:hypothetical protein
MMRSHSSRTLLAGVLALALAGVVPLAGCDDRKHETLVCKDGTVTGGAGARDVCARHGGVR